MDRRSLLVRLPVEVHDQIRLRAAERGMSVNRWITVACEVGLARGGMKKTETTEKVSVEDLS